MAEQNILNGNQKVLEQILGDIHEHSVKKERLDKLGESIKDLSKELENSENAKKNEIAARVKESTDAICESYDKTIAGDRDKIKRIQSDRDKAKIAGIKERISSETASLRAENEDLQGQINEAFIQENIAKVCNSRFFLAMFASRRAVDVIIYISVLLVFFAALPVGMYFVPHIPKWALLVYYGIVSVTFVTVYKCVYSSVLLPHRDTILAARDTKSKINSNKDKIKKIEKGIKRDKNEEMYGLEVFDRRINDLYDDISRIESDKQSALDEFERTVKLDILNEIEGRHQEKLDTLKKELSKKKEEYTKLDDLVKKQRIYISSNYEAYLGREFMNPDKLGELNSIMKSGAADTISQAVVAYKNRH